MGILESELTTEEKQALFAQEKTLESKIEQLQKLSSMGFKKTSQGFTFPGVNITEVDALMNKVDEKPEEIPDPDMQLLPITSKGEIKIQFNQDMIAPDVIIQSTYKNLFVVSITSSLDGSTAFGRF
jgi:hypothetical protein